ncbi:phosphoglucosamine mutase [Methanogenium sp. MK-MG]|uniref:phosphoglucosamine mutase n=1 Tax=Methanogenium sp. MK-MG TaxID=2599926 RepID=UPI0013EB99B7|nr:phosphoglucosamine mutase [Methanogenium sp. MK-MG]KAF1078596.1 Phosphoglucomutase/phosphomannomutase [Methanogenium sp. MK-MG]
METPEKQLFGTNGVRGIIGEEMNPELVMKIGMALGTMRKGRIGVGRDTRTSGPALSRAVIAGLLATGCDVVDLGVLPTPAVQYLVREHFDAGAVITASHNPPEYNGVKIIEGDGTEMDDTQTIRLEEHLFAEEFTLAGWEAMGTLSAAPEMIYEYINAVAGYWKDINADGMTIVADPGSGPACESTPQVLTKMGCHVVTINGMMDGTFPGRMPEPSPEGLQPLAELVRQTGAAFGVAHDGDADRAVFVDETGQYLEENEEFALIERFICSDTPGIVVTPVSTSFLAERIAEETGSLVDYTRVGSIYVARRMLALAEEGKTVVFGGEGNGGLILPGHQHCRDGAMTAATMVALLKSSGKKLSELRETLPPHAMLKDKIHTESPQTLLIKAEKAFSGDALDLTDGVRINRQGMWALLRPSGTEPFMRLYVEAETEKEAEAFRDEITTIISP